MFCTRLSELKAGDHIKVNRDKYDHHLLVVKAISEEEVHVIHYAGGDEGPRIRFEWPPTRPDMGLITEEVFRLNPAKVTALTFKDLPETLYPPEEAFERARTRLGEKRWTLFTNNCEHLVNWALTGVACSSQQDAVKEVGKDFLQTALKIGVFAGPVVGAAAGLAKAISSYKQYRNDDEMVCESGAKEGHSEERGEENGREGEGRKENKVGEEGEREEKSGEENENKVDEEQEREENKLSRGKGVEKGGREGEGTEGNVSSGEKC